MRDFRQSITKVTLAFVLLLFLTGCQKNEWDLPIAAATLPIDLSDTSISTEVEPTLPISSELPFIETTLEESSNTEIIETTEQSTKEELTTSIEETTEEITTEEVTTEEVTEAPTTIAETSIEEVKDPVYTFTEMAGYMYVQESVNVRTLPSTDGEIVTVYYVNREVWVTGRCNETGWYRIDLEGQPFYISGDYLGTEKVEIRHSTGQNRPSNNSGGFVYYTVAGRWPDYDYEKYLYSCLVDRGIAWWFPYAVAQIWLESCWSPTSYNGVDAGICQFNETYFPGRALHHANFPEADIWNPYDSLYVYSFYIRDILAGCNSNIEEAWSFYVMGHWGDRHDAYINACWRLYNALQAQ